MITVTGYLLFLQIVIMTFKLALPGLPVMQTESQKYVDKGFGAYLTEKITSAIGAMGPSMRLYEHSRLDAVISSWPR